MVLSFYNIRHHLVVFPVLLSEASIGFIYGWTAPMVKCLMTGEGTFILSVAQCAWVASLIEFGRAIGTLMVPIIIDILGRKKIFVSCFLVYFISWLIILLSESALWLLIARALSGLMIGINDATSPIYLGEVCSPKMRGLMSNLCVSFYFATILATFILSTLLSYRMVALVLSVVQFVLFIALFFARETPHFLIIKGKLDEAREIFRLLRPSDKSEMVDREFEGIVDNVHQEKSKLSLNEILSDKANFKSIVIGITISVLAIETGGSAILAFVSVAFDVSDYVPSERLIVLYAVCQLFSIYASWLFVGRYNRRTILICGFIASGIFHATSAILYYLHEKLDTQIPYFEWIIFTTITLFALVYSMTIMPLSFLLRGELFPLRVKALGACLCVTAVSIASFFTTEAFLHVDKLYGIYANFAFFSAASFVAVMFVYYYVPETRGKSLEEIRKLFSK